jgi:hypothetical protein
MSESNSKSDEDLRSCPFCGGIAEATAGGPGPKYWVFCRLCRASSEMFADPERARYAWNRRSEEGCGRSACVEYAKTTPEGRAWALRYAAERLQNEASLRALGLRSSGGGRGRDPKTGEVRR